MPDLGELAIRALSPALLIGVLAWAGKQVAEFFRRRREERAPVGRVLADLLDIRHHVLAIETATKLLREEVPLPAETEPGLKTVLMAMLPPPERLSAQYEEALRQIATTRPLVAFRLRSQDQVTPLLRTLRGLAAADQTAARLWAQLEPGVITAFQGHLDRLVREVARLHGWRTRWDVRRLVKKPFDVEPEARRLVKTVTVEMRKWLEGVGQRRLKAEADLRAIVSAVSAYSAHTGTLPQSLADLSRSMLNGGGVSAGPFLSGVPNPPAGWQPYKYTRRPDGTFAVATMGDGMTVTSP